MIPELVAESIRHGKGQDERCTKMRRTLKECEDVMFMGEYSSSLPTENSDLGN